MIKLVECPRDAMQGLDEFVPTATKITYLNSLLLCGFHTLDFGSFVSPKAIPQMRDTAEVLKGLHLREDSPALLAIVANERGAEEACSFEEIRYLGYPFSISEEFQKRNTNATLDQSSMAFGNPYGEKWHPDIATHWSYRLHRELHIRILALSDTIGISNPHNIHDLFSTLIPELPEMEFGAHLHTLPETWKEKVDAAYKAGCRRFDGALKGFGGCPMATDSLTGNMPTEKMQDYFIEIGENTGVSSTTLDEAQKCASLIFPA